VHLWAEVLPSRTMTTCKLQLSPDDIRQQPTLDIMEGLYYNVKYGYIEGIVRGYRNALLTSTNYSNLTQCENIDDVKLQLSPAYGDFLSSLPPNPSTSALAAKTTDKLVAEFRYIQANATGSLVKFMESHLWIHDRQRCAVDYGDPA